MGKLILPLLIVSLLLQSRTCISQSAKKGSVLVGIFDGRTPCRELTKQLNESTTPACIKIKWRLKLYKDLFKDNTGTYELEGYVFRKGNILKGKWHITKASKSNPEAIVYELENPRGPLFLQKVDDNIFFFLDQQKNLRIGDKDFSYTLNRNNEAAF